MIKTSVSGYLSKMQMAIKQTICKFTLLIVISTLIVSQAIAKDNFAIFDTSINQGQIGIGKSFEDSVLYHESLEFGSSGEKLYLINQDQTQVAILDFCCGNSGLITQRIVITTPDRVAPKRRINPTNIKAFISDHGFKVGTSSSILLKKLGIPIVKKHDKNSEYFEYFTQNQKFALLSDNNMPSYYSIYRINKKTKRIISIEFGFSEP